MLPLPIQVNGVPFRLCYPFSTFISVLEFSEQRLFASSGRFMPGFFFFFDVMANRIVSLISLSLLVYKNARDFCVLILYPATLPDSLMTLVVFW